MVQDLTDETVDGESFSTSVRETAHHALQFSQKSMKEVEGFLIWL
jgi:hypothetical protein